MLSELGFSLAGAEASVSLRDLERVLLVHGELQCLETSSFGRPATVFPLAVGTDDLGEVLLGGRRVASFGASGITVLSIHVAIITGGGGGGSGGCRCRRGIR